MKSSWRVWRGDDWFGYLLNAKMKGLWSVWISKILPSTMRRKCLIARNIARSSRSYALYFTSALVSRLLKKIPAVANVRQFVVVGRLNLASGAGCAKHVASIRSCLNCSKADIASFVQFAGVLSFVLLPTMRACIGAWCCAACGIKIAHCHKTAKIICCRRQFIVANHLHFFLVWSNSVFCRLYGLKIWLTLGQICTLQCWGWYRVVAIAGTIFMYVKSWRCGKGYLSDLVCLFSAR